MLDLAQDLVAQPQVAQLLLLGAVFGSVLLIVFGAASALAPDSAVARRLTAAGGQRPASSGTPLRRVDERAAAPIARFLTPQDAQERSRMRQVLFQAGYRQPHAMRTYYALRTALALLLPMPMLAGALARSLGLPALEFGVPAMLILIALLVALGFYGPWLWLRSCIGARQQAIREAFPNALDLIQVAVEAGLGFDAALARVAEELVLAHPVLAEEFALVGVELRAGKPREQVLNDLGRRTGVEEVGSFVAVINQSTRFGTSIVDALEVFSSEMRHKRMMAAEEMANKLPVKMSAVLVLFMLPAVLVVCLGPVVIRVVRVLAPAVGG